MDSGRDLPKGGVSPFGHPRINDRSHLPAAFRSVPRPSSPLGAKASTERPFHAPDRNRHRPHAGPSRARRRARIIPHERPWKPHHPARSRSHSQNYTTNSGFTCERTKASPAHGAGEACLLEAVPGAARGRGHTPRPGHPDARRHRTPAARASRHVRHEQEVGASRVESGACRSAGR
jgi:hypothetical protein